MWPLADGMAGTDTPVLLPIMAPRLQADCEPDGRITVAVWGVGTLATISFAGLAAPYRYGPNLIEAAQGGIYVAQSAPVMVIAGTMLRRLAPSTKASWWHKPAAGDAPAKASRKGNRRWLELAWGALALEQRGDDLVIAAGADLAEAEAALGLAVDAIIAEARAYVERCDRLPKADPLLRSMVIQGTHAALSSIRQDRHGQFAGLAAGQGYSSPARTYYRDGYWTLQPLLALAPEAVRGQIRLLAKGVQPDGEAPSAVILSGPAQSAAWDVFRKSTHPYVLEHARAGDWWSDHFDSPLFFVLTVGDYVRTSGDIAEAKAHWPLLKAIIERYVRMSGPDGLPKKPNNDRDWADNVYREGYVSYNLGLWVGALDAVAEMGRSVDPVFGNEAEALAKTARANIEAALWVEQPGTYADFRNSDGFVEDHVMADTLTLLRYDAVSADGAKAALETARTTLESRHNTTQPYGDWGVLCAYPPYKRPKDTRSKSAFAFRYHNGSDWPYLDGIYAEERLRRGLGDARYALTRWWQACLDSGWAGAVEYYSPPYGRGSLLQGWSGLPADVAVRYRDAIGSPHEG
ncbi:MAG: GH116 family glycosyl hydrolase [Devosia sp.]